MIYFLYLLIPDTFLEVHYIYFVIHLFILLVNSFFFSIIFGFQIFYYWEFILNVIKHLKENQCISLIFYFQISIICAYHYYIT